MSSSSFSPTGTPGISSTPYLHLSPISLAHIKGTDDWNGARWSVSGWKTVEITTHSYPFVKMTLFSRLLCFSRFFTHGEVERKAAASDVWKMPFSRGRDMVKEPLWWFSFLRFSLFSLTWTDCLRKAASSLSCFFYRPYMENFPRKMNLFRHHIYVCSLECHQIFSFIQFRCRWRKVEKRENNFLWNYG